MHKAIQKEKLLKEQTITIFFEVGNFYEHLKNPKTSASGELNEHRWTAFVRCRDEWYQRQFHRFVEYVKIDLNDDDFRTRVHKIEPKVGKLLSLTYNGWGTVTLSIQIYWRAKTGKQGAQKMHELSHELHFGGRGRWRMVAIPFDKDVLGKWVNLKK